MKPIQEFRKSGYLKRRRNKYLSIFYILVISFFVLFGLLVYLSRLEMFRVFDTYITGAVLVEKYELGEEVNSFLSGNVFFFFPKNNIFIYDKKELISYLENKFPRIESIKARFDGESTLSLEITERSPYALWCNSLDEEECFFMDKNATVYSKAPKFSGDAYFKYYGLIEGDPLGQKYFSDIELFNSLGQFINYTEKLNLSPFYLKILDNGQYELYLLEGGRILFDSESTLDQVAFNLEAILTSPDLASTTSFKNLDYIDLRFGNKLFYKLKSGTTSQ